MADEEIATTPELSELETVLEELREREKDLEEYRATRLSEWGVMPGNSSDLGALAVSLRAQRNAQAEEVTFELINTRFETIGGDPQTILYLKEVNACRFTVDGGGSSLSGATVKMDWRQVIGNADLERDLQFNPLPAGWKAEYKAQGQLRNWELVNTGSAATTAVFTIENLKLLDTAQQSTKTLNISWKIGLIEKTQGINIMLAPLVEGLTNMTAIAVGCCAPSNSSDWNVLQNDYQLTVPYKQADEIFINPGPPLAISNRLWFYLANTSTTDPITSDKTTFQVSFRTGEGRQALAKSNTNAKLEVVGGANWTVSTETDGGVKVWTLRRAGTALFGAGESVTLRFEGLSQDEVGMTAIDVAYFDFPKHSNGSMPIRVHKRYPEASILELEYPAHISAETTNEKAQVRWKTFGGVPSLRTYPDEGIVPNCPPVGGHDWLIGSNRARRYISMRLTGGSGTTERTLLEQVITSAEYVGLYGFGTNLGAFLRYIFFEPTADYDNFYATISPKKIYFRGDWFYPTSSGYQVTRMFEATFPVRSIVKAPASFSYGRPPVQCTWMYVVTTSDGTLQGRYFLDVHGRLMMVPQHVNNNLFGGCKIRGICKTKEKDKWTAGVTAEIVLPQMCYYEVPLVLTNSYEGGRLTAKECGLG